MAKKKLHLMQASLEFSDNVDAFRKDLDYVFDQEPDVIGWTEINTNIRREIMSNVARKRGYAPVIIPGSDSNLAVKLKGEADTILKGKGSIKAANGVPGAFPDRHVAWARIRWYERDIWVHEAHWALRVHGEDRHTSVTNMMAAQVKLHGKGNSLSFWMGDLNIDEVMDDKVNARNMPNYIFRANGLLSIYDELGTVPRPTRKSSVLDVVGSYKKDKITKGTRYKIHPKQRSDHSFVSAWYDIETKAPSGVTPAPDAPPGDSPEPAPAESEVYSDYWIQGGNISWKDYQDDSLYPLPYAYGDSDSHRHG